MLHLFLGLKGLVKVSRYHTDGSVFRLHYRVTVTVLLAFTFIVTTRQYIAEPIMCVHSKEIPKDVLNTYCWIHPTYTLSSAHWKRVGIDVPHPGVDKTRDDRDKKHVKYYQWVGFCLFLQVRQKKTFFESIHSLKLWLNQFTHTVWTVNDVLSWSTPFYWVDPSPFESIHTLLRRRVWINSRHHWQSTLYVFASN